MNSTEHVTPQREASVPIETIDALAVVFEAPEQIALSRLRLESAGDADVLVKTEWSSISTGTERLLWSGKMPPFPGMGYPLVPGYEAVGRIEWAGSQSGRRVGERVFVPGARCFGEVRGLFGGAASRLVVPGTRAVPIDHFEGGAVAASDAVLLALAATARHALADPAARLPELIVGHGVLGRLLARLTVLLGGAPVVWEHNAARRDGATGYAVHHPDEDPRRDYRSVYDVSGDAAVLDRVIARMAPGGEVCLAGFYHEALQFSFAPAFMREARIRIAAQWRPADLEFVQRAVSEGRLALGGLVTHQVAAADAREAYRTAFDDATCLKMTLDWRGQA